MSGGVVAAVLFAALLHASWNALVKSGRDTTLDSALIHLLGCGVGAVLVLAVGLPDRAAWPWVALSMVIHLGYYVTLAGAYRHADLGFAYPIMRGTGPLFVAVASLPLLGERLVPLAWLGVLGICGGVLLIGLARPAAGTGPRGPALRYALANAALIGGYTLVDGHGVRQAGDALRYVALLFLVNGLPFFLLVLWQRRAQWPQTRAHLAARWPHALAGAAASLGAYAIALWAMTRAPVASVAALRETSVLFAAAIGALWLKERFRPERALGTVVIVAGVVALRLA